MSKNTIHRWFRCTLAALTLFSTLTVLPGSVSAAPDNNDFTQQASTPFEAPGIQILEVKASETSFEDFGVRSWIISEESSEATGILVRHISGLSEDRQLLGTLRIQEVGDGSPTLRIRAPHLRGATSTLIELREQGWRDAFIRDAGALSSDDILQGNSPIIGSRAGTEKLAPGDPDPNLCTIKTIAVGAAFGAAVASCNPSPAALACTAAMTALALAINEMHQACGTAPPQTFCDPGSVAPCQCQYGTCDGIAVGTKICKVDGSGYSSCLGCPSSPPNCPDPTACPTIGIHDTSSWCADNECDGEQGVRTCNSDFQWDPCTCGDENPSNNCDFEGQTSPAACSAYSCPLGSTATKVCVRDPLDSNLTWSECFCDEPDSGGGGGGPEPPHHDDPGPWQDDCPWGPDGCDTVVSERRLCRTCNVLDVGTGNCLLWHPWSPC